MKTNINPSYRVAFTGSKTTAYQWCWDNIGPTDGLLGFSEEYPWYINMGGFVFRREQDAVLFALRWS